MQENMQHCQTLFHSNTPRSGEDTHTALYNAPGRHVRSMARDISVRLVLPRIWMDSWRGSAVGTESSPSRLVFECVCLQKPLRRT